MVSGPCISRGRLGKRRKGSSFEIGYAIDDFFVCELVGALRSPEREAANYVVAAPMLFESKADGSLASHATQSRLRLEEGVVRHDHSAAKALDRGFDRGEEEQADFLEDHGFLIETDKISQVVDAEASYTLEYVDMILSLKQKGWKVLFVPTARLEFRIAEFSWRDVPYFAYKRSEATCHGAWGFPLCEVRRTPVSTLDPH
jgi:hypothetical protein